MAGMTGTLSLDTRQYDQALQKAVELSKKFGDTVEVSARGAAAAFARMQKEFSGEKIQNQAKAMVAAVERIGGASRLTENEQRRVNSVVSEAIAKYQALGQTAPAHLLKLRDATQQTTSWMDKLKAQWV